MLTSVRQFLTVGIALVFLAACQTAPDAKNDDVVVQSENDSRHYQTIILANQLKVLLVSDPAAEKSAASLDVNIGSRQDPLDYQGLAHFLEHMLFLGTKKYPGAGDYQEFISSHGGRHNAYTSFEHTNYFFEIDSQYFDSGLDRFAQFFIAPLFTDQYVEREKNAVHSEYMSKIKDQGRKSADVFKSIIDQSHPYAKLSVGNLDTLTDRASADKKGGLRNQLLEFYQKNYSSGLMTLVLVGTGSLAELEKLARDKFSSVKNNGRRIEPITRPILDSDDLPLTVNIKPEKKVRTLSIAFPIDDTMHFYRKKPVYYLGNILGHEGKGSLLSYLKNQGWAEGLGAGLGVSYRNGATFNVSILLTEAGFEHANDVAVSLFQAINRIRVSADRVRLYEEQKKIATQQFRFQEKESSMGYATRLSSDMHYYDEKDILRGAYMMDAYDSSLIDRYLSFLVPENSLLTITAPSVKVDRLTHFYTAEYSVIPTPSDQLEQWRTAGLNPLIALPRENIFVADTLSVLAKDGQNSDPRLLIENDGVNLWFKSVDRFLSPKGSLFFSFRSPEAADTPKNSALLKLLVATISDELNEFSYAARLAGLHYSLSPHLNGFSVKVGGFAEKQNLLLDRILVSIRSPNFDQQRFEDIKREHVRRLENARASRPSQLVMGRINDLLYGNRWTDSQLLTAYTDIDIDALKAYRKTLLSSGQSDILVYGNYSQETAKAYGEKIAQSFIDKPLAKPPVAITTLPEQLFSSEVESDYSDASVVIYIQAAGTEKSRRAAMAVTAQLLRSDFYTSLRTEKQLGYIVSSGAYPVKDVAGLFFLIQSPVAGPEVLQREIADFLRQKFDQLSTIDNEKFLSQKATILTRLRESPKNQNEQSARYWQNITQGYYQFDFRDGMISALESLTLEQWQNYFATDVINNQRRLIAYTVGKFDQQSAVEGKNIDDIDLFKASLPFYRFAR
ncbi:MAG: insulinase family protein [Oceanicoccus sp.]